MKKIAFIAVTLGLMGFLIEASSALILFHSGKLTGKPAARFDYSEGQFASAVLTRKISGLFVLANNLDITPTPPQIYRPDQELGYEMNAGKGSIETVLRRTGRAHIAEFTILDGDGRATAYQPNIQDKGLWIFGDSVVFGGGNADEHAFPWLLQARHPDWQIRNLATSGHGNVQALLRLRNRASEIQDSDILIWGYADYLHHRNVPAPSLASIYNAEAFEKLHPQGLSMPVGYLEGDDLKIRLQRMTCEGQEDWCAAGDPPYDEQIRVTTALLEAFVAETNATTVVAFLEGADDDQVVAQAREMGLLVVDMRPHPDRNEADDFYPFDSHPGPLSHYHYFRKLSAALVDEGLIDPD